MKIFLSYESRNHEEFAAEIAAQLEMNGHDVWFDKKKRRTFLRFFASTESDFGLDGWLRKGILSSDMVVIIVPYHESQQRLPNGWEVRRPSNPEQICSFVYEQIVKLYGSWEGKASSKWTDPNQLDRMGNYLFHPIHTFRMVWYEEHFGIPLGKDPFEQWRMWEMRVAGAIKLSIVAVAPIEKEEDQFAEAASNLMIKHTYLAFVRRSMLDTDVTNKLIPTLLHNAPTPEKKQQTHEILYKLRRVENKLILRSALSSLYFCHW